MSVKGWVTVQIDYTTSLLDGTIIETTTDKKPLEFIVGKNQVIKGIDKAVIGMEVGEKKEILLKPGDAFGNVKPSLIKEIDRNNLPNNLRIGDRFKVRLRNNKTSSVMLLDYIGDKAMIDFNHPLAGKAIKIEIEIKKII